MREEPLYGNSACRRRGRKQIPLFLHCVEDLSGRWLSASQGGPEGPEDPNLRRVRTDLRTSISNPASATCLSLQQCRPQKTIVTSWFRIQSNISHMLFLSQTPGYSWSFDNKCEVCWPGINKLPFISPAKMGLFGFSKELQFRVCNHGKPHASLSHSKGRRTLL